MVEETKEQGFKRAITEILENNWGQTKNLQVYKWPYIFTATVNDQDIYLKAYRDTNNHRTDYELRTMKFLNELSSKGVSCCTYVEPRIVVSKSWPEIVVQKAAVG